MSLDNHLKKVTATHWVTKDGRRLTPAQMGTNHLRNTVNLLKRWGWHEKLRRELQLCMVNPNTTGDGAFDAVMSEMYALERQTVDDFLCWVVPTYRALVTELRLRAYG